MYNPPPAGLNDREIVIRMALDSEIWYRSHQTNCGPVFFGKSKTQRWDAPELKAIRSAAAHALLRDPRQADGAIDDVVDFFEDVGFLLKRGAISHHTAWQFFWVPVSTYHQATVPYRLENESEDAEVWAQFEHLYSAIEAQERALRKRHKITTALECSKERLMELLINESQLLGEVPRFRISKRKT